MTGLQASKHAVREDKAVSLRLHQSMNEKARQGPFSCAERLR